VTINIPDPSDFDLPDAELWNRLPGEPQKSYAAFRMYRDLSPMQRRFETIAQQTDLTVRRIRSWAAGWNWRERVDAWDDACHRIEDRERLDAIRSMHAIHRKAGREAVLKAVQALSELSTEQMTAGSIARLLELGAKLERSTLIVSVEELQGIETEGDDEVEDPWERIARELDPTVATLDE
jgi:hypothetical protein